VSLSSSWRQLSLDYSTFWGGSTLDFVIQDRPAKTSEVFQVDAVSIVIVTPAPAATLLYGAPGGVPAADTRLGMSPNPLRSDAQLGFATAREGRVSVGIFDLEGRRVRRLLDEALEPAGAHSLRFDGRADGGAPLRDGVYFYQIRSADGPRTGRFVIMK